MDLTPTEADLEEAATTLTELLGASARLDAARRDVREAQEAVADAELLSDAETRDIERLERPSWSRTLATLRGNLVPEHERQAAERAAAVYEAGLATERLRAARARLAAIVEQASRLPEAESRYDSALEAREAAAKEHDEPVAERLTAIAQERGRLAAQDRELREAHAAGVRALALLRKAHTLLTRAEGFASADVFGGDLLVGSWKYARFDQAVELLHDADAALTDFARELRDVAIAGVPTVEISRLTRTFDLFLDDLFTDLKVRRRIIDVRERTAASATLTHDRLTTLVAQQHEVADRLGALALERQRLLLGLRG